MSQRWQIGRILAELAAQCGLDRLELNADGRAGLTIGEIPFTLRYVETPAALLVMSAAIVEIGEDDTATPSFLLELTFTTWMKGIMTIGLAEDGKRALGYVAVPPGLLDADALARVLGQMVETTLTIRGELERGTHLHHAAAPGDEGAEPGPRAPSLYA